MTLNFTQGYQAFVNFAQQRCVKNDEKAVVHAFVNSGSEGHVRHISVVKAGENGTANDKAYALFRSNEVKTANAYTRTCFERCIAEVFGGAENIPPSVREQMTNFGTNKPLTARRIMSIANAISVLQDNVQTSAERTRIGARQLEVAAAATSQALTKALDESGLKGSVGGLVLKAIGSLMTLHRQGISDDIAAGKTVTDQRLQQVETAVRVDIARLLVANGLAEAAKALLGRDEFARRIEPDVAILRTLMAEENPPVHLHYSNGNRAQQVTMLDAPVAKSQDLLLSVLTAAARQAPAETDDKEVYCAIGHQFGQFCRKSLAEAIATVVGKDRVQVEDLSAKTKNVKGLLGAISDSEIKLLNNNLNVNVIGEELQEALRLRCFDLEKSLDMISEEPSVSYRQVQNLVRLNIARTMVAYGREDLACKYLGKEAFFASGLCEEMTALRLVAPHGFGDSEEDKSPEAIARRKTLLTEMGTADVKFLATGGDKAFHTLQSPYLDEAKVTCTFGGKKDNCGWPSLKFPRHLIPVPETVAKILVDTGLARLDKPLDLSKGTTVNDILSEELSKAVQFMALDFAGDKSRPLMPIAAALVDELLELNVSVLAHYLHDAPNVGPNELRNFFRMNFARFMIGKGMESLAAAYLGTKDYLSSGIARHACAYGLVGQTGKGRMGDVCMSLSYYQRPQKVNPYENEPIVNASRMGGILQLKDAMPDTIRGEKAEDGDTVFVGFRQGRGEKRHVLVLDTAIVNRFDQYMINVFSRALKESDLPPPPEKDNRQGVGQSVDVEAFKEIVNGDLTVPEDLRGGYERKLESLKHQGLCPVAQTIDFSQSEHSIKLMLSKPLTDMMKRLDANSNVDFVDDVENGIAQLCEKLEAYCSFAGVAFNRDGNYAETYDVVCRALSQKLGELGRRDDFTGMTAAELRNLYVADLKTAAERNDPSITWNDNMTDLEVREAYEKSKDVPVINDLVKKIKILRPNFTYAHQSVSELEKELHDLEHPQPRPAPKPNVGVGSGGAKGRPAKAKKRKANGVGE